MVEKITSPVAKEIRKAREQGWTWLKIAVVFEVSIDTARRHGDPANQVKQVEYRRKYDAAKRLN